MYGDGMTLNTGQGLSNLRSCASIILTIASPIFQAPAGLRLTFTSTCVC